ncbi:MAG TPA: hypothetical protein VFT51_06030 [Bacillales bacterium]|nr:hypothetical protein [Bacillales bacterium]
MSGYGKVIPLPGLHDRYVDKGIEEIKKGLYVSAEKCFRQALELGESTKVHFGMMMCLYQLGKLIEAREYCEELFDAEFDTEKDFYDYLQVYVLVLKDLQEYEEAVSVLKTVLQNQYVSSREMTEQCHQWLRFFLESIEETGGQGEESQSLKALDIHEGAGDVGWNPKQIRDHYLKELDEIKDTLRDKGGNPYIKSAILKDLKEKELNVTVPVHKFGQDVSVDIGEMKEITEDDFFVAVRECLSKALESDNPTLYNMALQLWEHFMITMFPLEIEPSDPEIWAAAVYKMVHDMSGMAISQRKAAEAFQVSEQKLIEAEEKIVEAEKTTTV